MFYALLMKKICFILIVSFIFCLASNAYALEGKASFYTYESAVKAGDLGIMANGKKMDNNALTCAFNGLPFNTLLKVTNLKNGRFVIVKITDRGGFHKYNRIIDLSKKAFESIADLKLGIIFVKIEVIK